MKIFGDEGGFFWDDIVAGNLPGLPAGKKKQPTVRAQRRGPRPESTWTPPLELPRLNNCLVGYDVETRDEGIIRGIGSGWCLPDRAQWGDVVGVGLCWGDKPEEEAYFPFEHPELPDLPYNRSTFFQYLDDQFKKPDVTWACHNAVYDMGWAYGAHKLRWPAGGVDDSETMAALINENRFRFGLNPLAKSELGLEKDEVLLRAAADHFGIDPKKEMYLLPAQFVGPYGSYDARLARALVLHFRQHVEWAALSSSIYPIEKDLVQVLIEMRLLGVRVDLDAAERLRDTLQTEELAALKAMRDIAGFDVGMWSENSIARVCDDILKIPYPRTEAGAPSFTKPWLEKQTGVPFFGHLGNARRCQKIKGTFVEGYILDQNINGRVYAEFHPLKRDENGAVTGRLSSSNPNLQNIPVRDDILGPMMRALFLPDDGAEWLAADYSQQEPRLTVHYAALLNVMGAQDAVRAWRANPRMDFHQFMADITGLPRKKAKNMFLGCCYGMGGPTLCRHLGLPVIVDSNGREWAGEEGARIMKLFHERAPFVNGMADYCKRAVRRRGYIRTIGGRRRHFPPGQSEHKALNSLIQGSAADMIKKAMVELWKRYKMVNLLTVHDELGKNTTDPVEDTRKVVEVMRDVYELQVPVEVDASVGANWHLAKVAA